MKNIHGWNLYVDGRLAYTYTRKSTALSSAKDYRAMKKRDGITPLFTTVRVYRRYAGEPEVR